MHAACGRLTVAGAGIFLPSGIGMRNKRSYLRASHSYLTTPSEIFAEPRGNREQSNGQAEIRTQQAALQCGDHWSRGPWQDDVDGGADEGVGGQGLDVELRAL